MRVGDELIIDEPINNTNELVIVVGLISATEIAGWSRDSKDGRKRFNRSWSANRRKGNV
jgi:hypothetical protein